VGRSSLGNDKLGRPSLRWVELICERHHVVNEGRWFGSVDWIDASYRSAAIGSAPVTR
jgi:hypothetical protein